MSQTRAGQQDLDNRTPSKKLLGNSGMELSPIGFGAWAVGGGDYQFGWGTQEDEDSIAAIHKSVELGINWIDTAAIYGLGHSEEVVGRALKAFSSNKPYVFTKCSMRWDDRREIFRNLSKEGVRFECEQSLRRLGVDVIDLYQIHWPDPEDQIEEGWEAMQELKHEGKIRFAGVSNFTVPQMELINKIAPITSLQPPYSLINRKVEAGLLPYCEQKGIGVINYSPMVSGLLTGKMNEERIKQLPENDWRRKTPNFNPPKLAKNLALADLLTTIARRHGVETGVIAIAWTLRQPAITAAIVGGRDARQVEGTARALDFRLNAEEIAEIDAFVAENGIGQQ